MTRSESSDKIIADLSRIQFCLQLVPASNPMLALPDPASNVASDVVFTSKESGVSVDDSAAKRYHRTTWLYILPLFPCFSIFFMFSHFFGSDNVVEFPCFDVFSKGVQLQLDRWPWNGEGELGAKGCVGTKCLGFFQPRQGLNVNLQKNNEQMNRMVVKISSCWLIFRVVSLSKLSNSTRSPLPHERSLAAFSPSCRRSHHGIQVPPLNHYARGTCMCTSNSITNQLCKPIAWSAIHTGERW